MAKIQSNDRFGLKSAINMNNKVTYQDLLWTALTPAGTNLTRWAVALAVVMIMLVMPQGTQAQTYKLGGNYVKFQKFVQPNPEEAGQYVEATEAAVGDEIIASVNNEQIPQGKYFTGEYSSQDLTLTTNWDGTFIMPAKDVTVNAVLAAQKDYTIDLTTSTTAVIPMEISILLSYLEVGGQTCSVYDNEYNWFLDLNVDGINDVEVKSTFDATTQDYIYSIEQLSGNGVYKTSCSFALNITPPEQYKSLIFNFKEVAPAVTLQSGWITVSGGPFTYTGQAIEPTVTVNDGTTDITGEFNVTYSNNKNAGEATVTVTAKTTSTSYTGSVSKTFTIKPMPVTITADGETKVYDGQPLTKNSYTHTELASGDAIKSVIVTGSQTDAGTSKNVPSGAVIQNAANENVTDNYAITYTNGTLTVTKASLNIITEDYSGVYDGAAHGITVKNVSEGLTVKYSEDNTNFGSNELKYTNVCDETVYWKVENNNYDLTSGASGNAQVTITPKAVTISGVKAKDKVYDGTTSAIIDAESAIIDGKVEGDALTVNAQSVTAVFADAEAGKNKSVTLSGNFSLAGDQAVNYTLSAQPANATGTITPKPVTVIRDLTVSSTTLNGITFYSVNASNVIIEGAVNNEKLSINSVIARLQNGSTEVCDLDYTAATIVIGVDKANNYVVAEEGNQATAKITASTETVTGADGYQTVTTSKMPDLDLSEIYSIATDGKVTKTVTGVSKVTSDVSGAISPNGTVINNLAAVAGGTIFGSVSAEGKKVTDKVVTNSTGSTGDILIGVDGVTNVTVNTVTKTDAQGNTKNTSSSITVKQNTPTGDGTSDGITNIALGLNSGKCTFSVQKSFDHGTVSVYPASANVGEWVTITVIPETGFKLERLSVTVSGASPVDPIKTIYSTRFASESNQYKFQAPYAEIFSIIVSIVTDGTGSGDDSGNSENSEVQESSILDSKGQAATTMIVNYGTNVENSAIGADIGSISADVAGADIDNTVDGGKSSNGTANGNIVTISGSAVGGAVYGGRSKDAAGNNNTVEINGGNVPGIVGGGTRGATAEQEEDDEIEIVSGKEYKLLRDGFIVLNFYTPDASITVNSIIIRRWGDANNDGYLNAADLVEMINAKNDNASERFNLTNADIDLDGKITQADIDEVVDAIMEQTDEE